VLIKDEPLVTEKPPEHESLVHTFARSLLQPVLLASSASSSATVQRRAPTTPQKAFASGKVTGPLHWELNSLSEHTLVLPYVSAFVQPSSSQDRGINVGAGLGTNVGAGIGTSVGGVEASNGAFVGAGKGSVGAFVGTGTGSIGALVGAGTCSVGTLLGAKDTSAQQRVR